MQDIQKKIDDFYNEKIFRNYFKKYTVEDFDYVFNKNKKYITDQNIDTFLKKISEMAVSSTLPHIGNLTATTLRKKLDTTDIYDLLISEGKSYYYELLKLNENNIKLDPLISKFHTTHKIPLYYIMVNKKTYKTLCNQYYKSLFFEINKLDTDKKIFLKDIFNQRFNLLICDSLFRNDIILFSTELKNIYLKEFDMKYVSFNNNGDPEFITYTKLDYQLPTIDEILERVFTIGYDALTELEKKLLKYNKS